MSSDRHWGKIKYKGERKDSLGGILYPDSGGYTNLQMCYNS